MSENKMSDIIKASLDGIRSFADGDTVVGNIISTPAGVTVIPVSKVSVGIATGGIDYGTSRSSPKDNFGGGGGTGVSITPVAFLAVSRDGELSLINLAEDSDGIDKIVDFVGRAPELIDKFKDSLS